MKPSYFLDPTTLSNILSQVTSAKVDAADVYLQESQAEHWLLEDGIVKEGSFSIDRGFGLRVISGEKTGFAYADEIEFSAIQDAAKAARSIARKGQSMTLPVPSMNQVKSLYPAINPLLTLTDVEKVTLLRSMDALAR